LFDFFWKTWPNVIFHPESKYDSHFFQWRWFFLLKKDFKKKVIFFVKFDRSFSGSRSPNVRSAESTRVSNWPVGESFENLLASREIFRKLLRLQKIFWKIIASRHVFGNYWVCRNSLKNFSVRGNFCFLRQILHLCRMSRS
jgi:hypothetical protein